MQIFTFSIIAYFILEVSGKLWCRFPSKEIQPKEIPFTHLWRAGLL